jgi:predicted GTPase
MRRKKVIIMGAAGRDFHNFNTKYRDNEEYEVVAFTATQIPNIAGRKYPAELSGKLYPGGIPIYEEKTLPDLIKAHGINEVVFSYSDVSHEYVMHHACTILANGANFVLLGPDDTMIESKKTVISVCAVRTGSGKSQTTRKVAEIVKATGNKLVVIRHPMPYGDLAKQKVQRFGSYEDMDKHNCTIEEREEYEPHIKNGIPVYAGVDYGEILKAAEQEADVILWDGGNNDFGFYKAHVEIVVVDPHRAGHELSYFPGEVNLKRAHIIVINKIDTADRKNVELVRANIRKVNPKAKVVDAASPIFIDNPEIICGKKVLVIEDGPTLTHGEMSYGAGVIAAIKFGASELLNPRNEAVGSIRETYAKYPHIGNLLPAMGYSPTQIAELETTINKVNADLVIIATPIDLRKLIKINKPAVRIAYELQEIGVPTLTDLLIPYLQK